MRPIDVYWKEVFYRALGEYKKRFSVDNTNFFDDVLFVDFLFKQDKGTKGSMLDEIWCYNVILWFATIYENVKNNQSTEFWVLNLKDLLKSRVENYKIVDKLDLFKFLNL